MMLLCILLLCSNIPSRVHAQASVRDIIEVKYGNFLLPTSQQPSPLLSLGQNIVDKGDILAVLSVSPFTGPSTYSVGVLPGFLYGLTDKCSLLVGVPFSFLKDGCGKSQGLADIFAQIEYAFYESKKPTAIYQGTCIASLFVPTGSTKQGIMNSSLLLGTGSPLFLFGGTLSYYTPEWLWFLSAGGTLATKGHVLRAGSNFLYQGGFGKNIRGRDGWIIAWIVELNGMYTTRQQVCSVTQRDSGGNVLYFTPSLWVSSKNFILQAGVTLLPVQHLFGCQNRKEIGGVINLAWKFNG